MVPVEDNNVLLAGDAVNDTGTVRQIATAQHLGRFAGGMLALGGKVFENATHVEIGDRLGRSCAWAYGQFPTGIMPEKFGMIPCANLTGVCWFDEALWRRKGDVSVPPGFTDVQDPRYLLRPEAIESLFWSWRMTRGQGAAGDGVADV